MANSTYFIRLVFFFILLGIFNGQKKNSELVKRLKLIYMRL